MREQRDFMRRLYVEMGGDETLVLFAYAEAEASGEVTRKRNEHDVSALDYARALWRDGMRRGWIFEDSLPSPRRR